MSNTFHRVGHGPHPVIVLHGWFGDCHAFAPMEDALSQDEFSYIFMDYRGYGGMRTATGAYIALMRLPRMHWHSQMSLDLSALV